MKQVSQVSIFQSKKLITEEYDSGYYTQINSRRLGQRTNGLYGCGKSDLTVKNQQTEHIQVGPA